MLVSALSAMASSDLVVKITYSNGRTPDGLIRVELVSAYGAGVTTQTMNPDGSLMFRNIGAADYKLRITGSQIQEVDTEAFSVGDSGPVDYQYVTVKPIAGADQMPPGTLVASEANVPKGAVKELKAGLHRFEDKKFDEAREHFQKAIDIYPKYASAYADLGETYLNLKDEANALKSFEQAVVIDEHNAAGNLEAGRMLYEQEKFKEAEPYLARTSARDPKNPQFLITLANAELQNGELDNALATAQRVQTTTNHTQFASAHIIAGDVLGRQGKTAEQAKEYQLFLQEAPDSPIAPQVKQALARLKEGK